MTTPNEVRVACPHDQVGTFVRLPSGFWKCDMQGAELVTYPRDGLTRLRRDLRCDRCHVNVPVIKPESYSPFLDGLVGPYLDYLVRERIVTRVSPTVVDVPLDVMAAAAGAGWQLPDPKLLR